MSPSPKDIGLILNLSRLPSRVQDLSRDGNRAIIVTTSIMLVMLKPLRTILVVAFKVLPVVLARGPPFYNKSR